MRWAFWRSDPQRRPDPHAPQRALPDDVGLPTAQRPKAVARPPDPDDRDADDCDPADRDAAARHPGAPAPRPPGATPAAQPSPTYEAPLTTPTKDLDRTALAAAGPDLAEVVTAVRTGAPVPSHPDPRALAVAATGALAARLPALSGVEGAAFDEPADELLHAYADLLAGRAARRAGADREDLLAVAHVAVAAAAVDAAGDPALLLLAGVPAEAQLLAAAHLLAQTADDGAAAPDALPRELRALFGTPG